MHLMHVPFVPMHSRDMGRPFDPMNRGGMERGGQPYPPFPGRNGGRVSGGSGLVNGITPTTSYTPGECYLVYYSDVESLCN